MATEFYLHSIKTKQQLLLAKNILDTHANYMKILVDGKWISFKRFCTIPADKREFIMNEVINNNKRNEYIRENKNWTKHKHLNWDSILWDSPMFLLSVMDYDEIRIELSNYFHGRVLKLTPKVIGRIKCICRTVGFYDNEGLDKFIAKNRGNYAFVLYH
jgi:hypothetical protein